MLIPIARRQCSTWLTILLTIGSLVNALGIEWTALGEQAAQLQTNDGTHSHDHASTHHHHAHQLSPSSSKVVQRRRIQEAAGSLQRCGTEDLPKNKAKIFQERIAAMQNQLRRVGTAAFAFATVTIDVSFHVIYDALGETGNISDAMVNAQVQVLNTAYAPHGFQFRLRELVRTDNAEWYNRCGLDDSFKGALRNPRDGPNVLYFYTCLPSNDDGELFSYATFPVDYVDNPALDGVVCIDQSLPGGTNAPQNLGDTAVHEVGHWLGLFHTFAGGCSPATGGDYVKDTPAQAEPSVGCPVGSDTCPDQPGLDPINNYMDYSDDECLTQFTAGQAERMQTVWRIYRSSIVSTTPSVALTDGVPLTGQALSTGLRQSYILKNIPILAKVTVKLSGSNGDADLFVDLCSSITINNSNESCTSILPLADGTVSIEVFAAAAFTGMTITATIERPPFVNLALGVPAKLSLVAGGTSYYVVPNVPKETTVQVDTMGASGDADIYVYSGNNFDRCVSEEFGSDETCSVSTFLPSSVFVVLTALEAFDDLTILATAIPKSFVALSSGMPVSGVGLAEFSSQFYVLNNVPAGSIVDVQTSGGTDGDAELLVYVGDLLTPACSSASEGSIEACQVIVDRVNNVFIEVFAFTTVSGLTVQADVSKPRTAYAILSFILSVFSKYAVSDVP